MQKVTVKDRMLKYGNLANISKTKIAKLLGISPSNFMPSNDCKSISSELVVRFLTAFPEISAEWLLRGEEPMLRQITDGVINGDVTNHAENNSSASIVFNFEKQTADIMKAKDDLIENLQKHVASLQHTIELMQRNLKD